MSRIAPETVRASLTVGVDESRRHQARSRSTEYFASDASPHSRRRSDFFSQVSRAKLQIIRRNLPSEECFFHQHSISSYPLEQPTHGSREHCLRVRRFVTRCPDGSEPTVSRTTGLNRKVDHLSNQRSSGRARGIRGRVRSSYSMRPCGYLTVIIAARPPPHLIGGRAGGWKRERA